MSWTFPSIDNPLTNQILENNMTTKEKYVMCQIVIAKEMTHYFDHKLATENVNFFLAYWNWSRE